MKKHANPGLESLFGLFGGDSHRRAVEGIKREYARGANRHRQSGAATRAGSRQPHLPFRASSTTKALKGRRPTRRKARRLNGREQLETLFGPKRNPRGQFVKARR